MRMRVQVVIAWPHRFEQRELELREGASVADAVRAAALGHEGEVAGYAVFGAAARPETPLRDGDRVELLRPLLLDPKEARRRRAGAQRGGR
ncbi:RnfH family protein [Pseudoxanthomonas sp. SGNA-20]|nr:MULTISPECIES: RnfH family protein [Pseudoxanthomonas]RRN57419.1 RnfH family protein [Pseudoxanthomonas sp. SGNA-20]RRN80260.1 RnfH family protein [Pseudoxanthomonas sp. SGD-10]